MNIQMALLLGTNNGIMKAIYFPTMEMEDCLLRIVYIRFEN